jgi:hypothetical protein
MSMLSEVSEWVLWRKRRIRLIIDYWILSIASVI